MEVAGQWRREWAGAAEYGKVTEGGVTRRVARALEVLHASAPGARVRVMRAAYHSSAGPGAPAASYMLHSSRRVISSGSNFLESPSFPSKPLEISSTPLEILHDNNVETENYKVTEPDDFEISEPSKWKASTSTRSIRMPSEESSSTDNASIIDIDSRARRKNIFRKYSYDSENSDILTNKKTSARSSPLLDPPVTLSTLKYKSLLNGSNEWNNRRKSYSFENTSSVNETVLHSNDNLAMESSTDSGICKSSEIMNDHIEDITCSNFIEKHEIKNDTNKETFKDWLTKNRASVFYKGTPLKSYKEHDIVIEEPGENNITVQSTGKVTITLPINIEVDDDYQYNNNHANDDGDRRVKKVEFCKTELHFAAESGKVNIIATDEKPPPTNDFRRRRSAFVPMNDTFDKPITLFGEKIKESHKIGKSSCFSVYNNSEIGESDENTAATKSILKNKIPKPKPYLLGENMVFGKSDSFNDSSVSTAVSLINKQLQSERRCSNETTSSLSSEMNTRVIESNNAVRTISAGPSRNNISKMNTNDKHSFDSDTIDTKGSPILDHKLKALKMSPVRGRAKTRQLRDSDLTYFGIKDPKRTKEDTTKYRTKELFEPSNIDEIFHSVRLIQQISNSVCNSEAESEDTPEYQNIPVKTNFAPIPTPRSRSKFEDKSNEFENVRILKPIIEQSADITELKVMAQESRRTRVRRNEDKMTSSSRSLSEPPKISRSNTISKSYPRVAHLRTDDTPTHRSKVDVIEHIKKSLKNNSLKKSNKDKVEVIDDEIPMYVNLNDVESKSYKNNPNNSCKRRSESRRKPLMKPEDLQEDTFRLENGRSKRKPNINDHLTTSTINRKSVPKPTAESNKNTSEKRQHHSLKRTSHIPRTEKLRTPDLRNNESKSSINRETNICNENKSVEGKRNSHKKKLELRNRSSQQQSTTNASDEFLIIKEKDKLGKNINGVVNANLDVDNDTNKTHNKYSTNKKEPLKTQEINSNLMERYHNSVKLNNSEKHDNGKMSNVKLHNNKTHKRSEYVINYDDKNGTVSSIRKIKTDSGASNKKKSHQEKNRDSSNETKVKNKTALRNAGPRSSRETKRPALYR